MKRGSAEDTYNTVNGSVVWNDDLWKDATWIPTTQHVSLVRGDLPEYPSDAQVRT